MWTSSSSSSCSSSLTNSILPKTMEEVWKDITFPCTDTDLPTHPLQSSVILQDFFSRPPPPHSAASPPPPPPLHPPPVLSLNSVPQHFSSLFLQNQQQHPISHDNSNRKKRFPEVEKSSGDRRHKRMIKNRESAARSRARKQAYTNELELEVAHLQEENAKLKEKQQQLCIAAAAAQHQKKKPLNRASTAPF